ncbi:Transcriptional adapter 3-like [Cricetulus griseus]|nr:Transcriptional adapter 3-like [Cricetulus griseus]
MADNEVMDAFRKIMAARQKKRTPTKKEKDQAWKTLTERTSILKLLDGQHHLLLATFLACQKPTSFETLAGGCPSNDNSLRPLS